MSRLSLGIRWPFLLAFAFVLGFATKGLWLSAPVVAGDDAMTARAIHLTDASGNVRATLRLGDDGIPRVDLLDENGQLKQSEPIVSDQKPIMPYEVLYGLKEPYKTEGSVTPHEPKCLVLSPQVGFAGNP